MKQVKAEVIDLEYEDQDDWQKREEDEDAMMVAQKIKQEFRDEESSPPMSRFHTNSTHVIQEAIRGDVDRPSPLVFDHFICMRIGLNSRNNVQRLMALLSAHEFVDLTVLPSPSILPPPMPPLISMGVHQRMMAAGVQEPSTSGAHQEPEIEQHRPKPPPPPQQMKIKKTIIKKISNRHFIRPSPSADCGIIPINLQCKKCEEVIPKGSHGSSALNHVQKVHLKMAAFQCRICKHYRTTQERIQSHVTTVHKAKSTKFDSSLAGPLSSIDMRKMEEMINVCFPQLKMELQVTDRLIAKTMEVDLSKK